MLQAMPVSLPAQEDNNVERITSQKHHAKHLRREAEARNKAMLKAQKSMGSRTQNSPPKSFSSVAGMESGS